MDINTNYVAQIPKQPLTDKIIVLDIDETLVHTFDKVPRTKIKSDRYYEITVNGQKYAGLLRPHVIDFLFFCFCYFSYVIVWSAGEKEYVHKICDILFKNLRRPDLIMTRDDCSTHEKIYTKPLVIISEKIPDATMDRMLILDDRETSFSITNKDNGILIIPYEPVPSKFDKNDDALLTLMNTWFLKEDIAYCEDVRKENKSNIFTEQA